jgi:hypothetical protein
MIHIAGVQQQADVPAIAPSPPAASRRASSRKRRTPEQAQQDAAEEAHLRARSSAARARAVQVAREARRLSRARVHPPAHVLRPLPYALRLNQNIQEWQYAKCGLQPESPSPESIVERVAAVLEAHRGRVAVHTGV